ncbi:hypothetical protein ACOMHN_002461 [Nucella lapillus]
MRNLRYILGIKWQDRITNPEPPAPRQLDECTQYRTGRRALTREATKTFENNRRDSITEARERRKTVAVAPKPPGQFPCGRLCRSRLGLHSHLRVHPCT